MHKQVTQPNKNIPKAKLKLYLNSTRFENTTSIVGTAIHQVVRQYKSVKDYI